MLITALRRTASDRFTVVLADGSEIESSLGVVTDLRLFTGKDLEEEELAALRRDSSRSLARDRALEMISRRLMSRKELREKLLRKGADVDAADYSADWLQEHRPALRGQGLRRGPRPLRARSPRRGPGTLGRSRGADARRRREAAQIHLRAAEGPERSGAASQDRRRALSPGLFLGGDPRRAAAI